MATQRWTLYDPALDETWVFPVNPNRMSTVHAPRSLNIFGSAPFGRVVERSKEPFEWTFSGYVRSQQHHDDLVAWSHKVNKLHLTDHFLRTFVVRFLNPSLDEKRPTMRSAWRFDYECTVLHYGVAS